MTLGAMTLGAMTRGVARGFLAFAFTLSAFALAPSAARAQTASPSASSSSRDALVGVFRADADAPVTIEADSLSFDQTSEAAIFEGRVRAVQGLLTLEADRARASFDGPAGLAGSVRALRVEGSVALRAGLGASAQGAWAEYDVVARRMVMEGDPVTLRRGGDVLVGRRLTLDLASGKGSLSGGRVRGVLAPTRRR